MWKRLALLCLFCALPCLFGQRGPDPMPKGMTPRDLVSAGGRFNGNWWVYIATDSDKTIWMEGFTNGEIKRTLEFSSEMRQCRCDCLAPWPKGDISVGGMQAEVDAFYFDKANTLIPVSWAVHLIAKRLDGRYTMAEYNGWIATLRKSLATARP
jgi:hypothetical protein